MSQPLSRQPFLLQRIDHVVFRVKDLHRSVDFYQRVLGCSVVKVQEHLGLVHLRAGASLIDLISLDGALGRQGGAGPAPTARNVEHVCLRINPFDEADLIAHLARHAVSPTGKAMVNFGAEGDGLSLYFADPDGNLIELKGPSTGSQP